MKEEERDDHMIIAKIAYCRPVIELKKTKYSLWRDWTFLHNVNRAVDLVMEELEETSSLSSSSAQGVDSLSFDMN